eukprot:scaffold60897_cov38-Prasinocladus_malaysianus.AAC.1
MHVDGQHLFQTELPPDVQLPPSVMTIFIPLVDLRYNRLSSLWLQTPSYVLFKTISVGSVRPD